MNNNKPDFVSYDWFGEERRLQDPVSRLNRALYHDIRQANDSLELVAKLETLGCDQQRAKDLGFDSIFNLAEALFERSPRKPSLRNRVVSKRYPSLWRQVTILVALILSLRLLGGEFEAFRLHGPWLLVWAIVGSYLLQISRKRQNALQTNRMFSLLIFTGSIGLLLLYPTAPLLSTVIALLWLAITGNSWLERYASQSGAWSILAIAIATLALLPVPHSVTALLLAGISLFLFIPYLTFRLGDAWWLLRWRSGQLLLALISSVALAWLLNQSLRDHSQHVATGLFTTVLVALLAEWGFAWFRQQLGATLWRTGSRDMFQQDALRLKVLFGIFLFIIVAGLLFSWYIGIASSVLVKFGFLGLIVALTLPLLKLDVLIPAVLLSLAVLLILSGLPTLWVLAGLIAFLGIGFLLSLRQVESFGSYLL